MVIYDKIISCENFECNAKKCSTCFEHPDVAVACNPICSENCKNFPCFIFCVRNPEYKEGMSLENVRHEYAR